jgi:60 kDa SS-A/Ro ribonucleoprotein
MGLVILSAGTTTEHKTLTKQIFNSVIITPKDLQDFVSIVKTGNIRTGMGRMLKTLVGNKLRTTSGYHAIKYAKSADQFSLRNLYRLARPKPEGWTDSQRAVADYLIHGQNDDYVMPDNADTLIPQIFEYEQFKLDNALERITRGNLPAEVVLPRTGSMESYAALIDAPQVPYMWLLRNVRNLATKGVFDGKDGIIRLSRVAAILTNPERVAKSRQFPHAFMTAYNAFVNEGVVRNPWGSDYSDGTATKIDKAVSTVITEALGEALELSLSNMPQLPGTTAICVDISGSMCGLLGKSKNSYLDIAATMAAGIIKTSERAVVYPFDTHVHEAPQLSRRDSVLSIAARLAEYRGGGTSLSAPWQSIAEQKTSYDNVVMFTDNESWVDHLTSGGWRYGYETRRGSNKGSADIMADYRKKHPDTKTFLVTLAPYGTSQFEAGTENLYEVFGWSDNTMRFISDTANGIDSVASINETVL